MRLATYSCTALLGTNKTGEIKPDANGYYTLVVGALDYDNSAGAEYGIDEEVLALFEDSSAFMRRIKLGRCYAEVEHPTFTPNMDKRAIVNRVMTIDSNNTCAHISEVWLDRESVKVNGKAVVAIMAKVKPEGLKSKVMEDRIKNPKSSLCFSIRSLTRDVKVNGKIVKYLRYISTFDLVTEPGIDIATKHHSPSLESISSEAIAINDDFFEDDELVAGLGIESSDDLKELEDAFEVITNNDHGKIKLASGGSLSW